MKKFLVSLILILFMLPAPLYADNIDDATVYYNEAIDYYSEDNIEKSVDLFKRATELNPDFYEAYYNLAQILMSQDRDEEAVDALKEVARLKPDDTENLYNLGKIQYKKGYLTNSMEYLSRIPKTAPQYSSAKIIMDRIEKRQKELSLERKIKERRIAYNEQGELLGDNLVEIKAPSGIATDSTGNIYAASFSENIVYKISPQGQKTVFSSSGLIKGIIGLAVDKNNNLYAANYLADSIIKITPKGDASVFARVAKPYCLIYDREHERLYVTEQNSNKLVKFDL